MGDLDNPRPADWIAVECILDNFAPGMASELAGEIKHRDARGIAKFLAHWMDRKATWALDVLYALGYSPLADKIACGETPDLSDPVVTPPPPPVFNLPPDITIDRESYTDTYQGKTKTMDVFVVRAPFNETFNDHRVPGRWFDKSIKAWRVPVKSDAELLKALHTSFPGHTARMPDGKTFAL